MRINTNINAQNTLRNLNNTTNMIAESTAKLSSGFRINKASDDAAGLAIANKLRNTGAALTQASRNNDQASAMLQIADGGASQIASILDRMKELATQAASANVGSDAGKLDAEYQQLKSEITRIVNTTVYQGQNLLDGTAGGGVTVTGASTAYSAGSDVSDIKVLSSATGGITYTLSAAAGSNGVVQLKNGATVIDTVLAKDGAQSLTFANAGVVVDTAASFKTSTSGLVAASFDGKTVITAAGAGGGLNFVIDSTGNPTDMTKDELNVSITGIATTGLSNDLNSQASAATAMGQIDTELGNVATALGTIGAAESRLGYASQVIATKIQNYSAAQSTIRDVDMAAEMANFSKSQILQQAGTAMLAQANQSAQSVLKLFQ
ncbi:MAG: flagellin [Gemmatimonadaceae bacterium]